MIVSELLTVGGWKKNNSSNIIDKILSTREGIYRMLLEQTDPFFQNDPKTLLNVIWIKRDLNPS